MATAAFKSTSKRGGNPNPTTVNNAASNSRNSHPNSNPFTRKRSQSVSAFSISKPAVDISSEFSNRRENPLFRAASTSSSSSPTDNEESNGIGKRTAKEEEERFVGRTAEAGSGPSVADRGRSVTRNSGFKNGIGRSLSRVRQRSLSREPFGAYESEKEKEMTALTNTQSNSDMKRLARNSKLLNGVGNCADVQRGYDSHQIKGIQSRGTDHSEDDSVCSFQLSNWEDVFSTYSLSESEERTSKAVFEQMKASEAGDYVAASGIYETIRSEVRCALSDIQLDFENAIQRSNANDVPMTDVDDIPPDSRHVELVLDIRREYARKLEESEERARKLKADLAVEEHRRQEFSRILKETLPDPQTSNPQKSRMGRKRSAERKKMSKRLTEEAMVYFDECVSISTFDSSDFSASEDPPSCAAGTSNPIFGAVATPQGSMSINPSLHALDRFSNNQKLTRRSEASNLISSDGSFNAFTMDEDGRGSESRGSSGKYQFSFAQKPEENVGPKSSIKSYTEHFQKGISVNVRSEYDSGECKIRGSFESFLFDRVFFSNRLESGSLHLCGGSIAVSFSPFGSVL